MIVMISTRQIAADLKLSYWAAIEEQELRAAFYELETALLKSRKYRKAWQKYLPQK